VARLDLGEVAVSLRTVAAAIQPLAEKKGLTLLTQAAAEVTTLYADEGRFKQVLYNLLSNAVKFTPPGGRVETTAGVAEGLVAVTVADTGPGIHPRDQERIFEAFQQVGSAAARRQEGTGLGLALARRLVELQGGRIWVESEPGQGSRFHFTVPLTPGARAARAGTGVVAEPASARLLLVIDAAAGAAERLGALLGPDGYTILHAADAAAGVALAVAYGPAAVLVDWRLPGPGLADAVARLRANAATRTIPIVVLADEELAADERAPLEDQGLAVLEAARLDRERLLAALGRPQPPPGGPPR
jgi:CheY-like chemotaxis protein